MKSTVNLTQSNQLTGHRRRGFSLIELLAVVVVIAILASIVIGVSSYVQRQSSRQRTMAEIRLMESILDIYKADFGDYPIGDGSAGSSGNLYRALACGPKQYLKFRPSQLQIIAATSTTNIMDAYGFPYRYRKPGLRNITSFDLWSFGPDTKSSTTAEKADDINNWD